MKARNHSTKQTSGTRPSPGRKRALPLETASKTFAAAGLAGLLALIIVILPKFVPGGLSENSATPQMARYLRSGQLLADVRTAVGMVQYVLEPDPPAVNPVIEPGGTLTNLVTSGRPRTVKPKV